jgi:NTP pyrophosphatase (non-canonical NTP hydrolase)
MNADTTAITDLWQHVTNALTWLDAANGRSEHQTAMQILKITEEAGEAAAAYIGMTGQNPRKGVTHTREDLADELCDVAITALVALATVTGDADTGRAALNHHIAKRGPRLAALMPERTSA